MAVPSNFSRGMQVLDFYIKFSDSQMLTTAYVYHLLFYYHFQKCLCFWLCWDIAAVLTLSGAHSPVVVHGLLVVGASLVLEPRF